MPGTPVCDVRMGAGTPPRPALFPRATQLSRATRAPYWMRTMPGRPPRHSSKPISHAGALHLLVLTTSVDLSDIAGHRPGGAWLSPGSNEALTKILSCHCPRYVLVRSQITGMSRLLHEKGSTSQYGS